MPAASQPRYFVAVISTASLSIPNATDLVVVSSASGHIVGQLAPPGHGRYFQAVAALGNDRTFVAEATLGTTPRSVPGCDTWFYWFRLASDGRATSLIPLVVPEVTGIPELRPSLGANATGTSVGFETVKCSDTPSRYWGRVGIIHLPSGKVTGWRSTEQAAPISRSPPMAACSAW